MFGIADSFDESAEVSVQIDQTQHRAYVLLDVTNGLDACGIYLDREAARALARELTTLASSGVMQV